MAFIKSDEKYETRVFRTFLEAQKVFENQLEEESSRLDALNYILGHQEISYVLDMLLDMFGSINNKDHYLIDHAFANFGKKPKREDDYHILFKLLKSDNAYLRNKAITFLQDYGEDAKSFIKKLLTNSDNDIKIFAVNILGDVKYEDSREMLLQLIKGEQNVNVLMTAVDYLGEIGELEDIDVLEEIKSDFSSDPYVCFGIDVAIDKIRG